jgi:DNA-binding transcriptional ArsR family regulator
MVSGHWRLDLQASRTLDRTFSALADHRRCDILTRLDHGPASISELAEPHVQILEGARLVTTEKVGRVRQRRLGPDRLDGVALWVETHRKRWQRRIDGLTACLDQQNQNEK